MIQCHFQRATLTPVINAFSAENHTIRNRNVQSPMGILRSCHHVRRLHRERVRQYPSPSQTNIERATAVLVG